MNRLALTIFLGLISVVCNGQESKQLKQINLCESHNSGIKPIYILVIDSIEITLDSTQVTQLNLEQIKTAKVAKSKNKRHYNNSSGVILIYPKKKFKNELLKRY